MVDEALDFYEKANGRDRTQKRQELENMRPGELRRSLERWQAHAKEVQRLQEKKEHAWDLYNRVPSFGRKKEEDFERDFAHKVMYSGKVDEKRLQEWTDEMQSKVQRAERELEARERKWMESEDSNSQRRRAWEKLWQPGTFSDVCCRSSVSERHESLARTDQLRIYDISPFETWRDVLCVSRVYSSIPESERSTSNDFMIRSAKKLMVEPSATMDLGIDSGAIQNVSSSTRISCGVHPARTHVSDYICDSDRDWH